MVSQVNSNNLEETKPIFYTFFQNIEERTLSNSFYETIALLLKPDITGKLMSSIFHDHRHKKFSNSGSNPTIYKKDNKS